MVHLPKRKCMRVTTNVYSRKTLEKPKKKGRFACFENNGLGVV